MVFIIPFSVEHIFKEEDKEYGLIVVITFQVPEEEVAVVVTIQEETVVIVNSAQLEPKAPPINLGHSVIYENSCVKSITDRHEDDDDDNKKCA